MTTTATQEPNMSRYTVSNSAGTGFAVWDRVNRTVVARRATFRAAQRVAQSMNRVERDTHA